MIVSMSLFLLGSLFNVIFFVGHFVSVLLIMLMIRNAVRMLLKGGINFWLADEENLAFYTSLNGQTWYFCNNFTL